MNFKKRSLGGVSAAALGFTLALVPSLVTAQQIETVTVTAQKRSQSLQDVSAAVSAVSQERLVSGHINNIEDLQVVVPNIYLGNDFNMAKTFIRGVGANTSTTGSETGVAMHVDGAFVSRAEAQLTSLFDLERVEVLRGPQGSLYGRNAVGGSINLITAKPTREFEGYVRGTYGNYNAIIAEGAISGPLGDAFAGRLALKSETRDGFGSNPVTGNDVDDLNRQMARAHLFFMPSDTFDVLLTGEYYTQDDASRALKFRRDAFPGLVRLRSANAAHNIGVPAGGAVLGGYAADSRDLASEVDPKTETETWSVTGTINWQLSDNVTLTNITNYREIEGFITQDLDLSSVVSRFYVLNPGAGDPPNFNTTVQRRDIKSEQFSTEQQLKYSNEWLNAVLGAFYFEEDQQPVDTVGLGAVEGDAWLGTKLANGTWSVDGFGAASSPFTLAQALDLCNTLKHGGGPASNPKRVCIKSALTNESWALFGQTSINLGVLSEGLNSLSIKLGGRYSEEEVTAANPSIIFAAQGISGGVPGAAGPPPVTMTTTAGNFNSRKFTNFSPEAGVEWRPSSDVMFYYTYSEGFKAGAGENNQGPQTAAVNFRSIIVDPEEITNHEAGLKTEWFDNRLILNLAAFSYKLEGQQINNTIAGGPAGFGTQFQNAAKTSAQGAELDFTALLSDNFRIGGALSYLDSTYDEFVTRDPLDPRNVATAGPCPGADPVASCFVAPSGVNVSLAGNPTRNSPKWSGSLHLELDLPGLALPNDGLLTLMSDISYKDDVFFTEFHRLLEGQEAVALLDFNLRFTSGDQRLKADLWIKNATDELVTSSTFQLATARVIGATYMPPRTFGLTIGYDF